jgi:rubredoxin---NAD+ reductase
MHPIVIIGSGMAAYAVAREFRKLNPEHELVMICADDAVNYAKPTLSNALTAQKKPDQIALGDAEKMSAQLNMRIETQTWVKQIDAEQHLLHLEKQGQDSTQAYSKLVLALGATPIRPQFTADAAQDILVVNHLDDYKQFREQLDAQQAKHILILGAGLIGCEFANDLNNNGYQVTVVDLAAQTLGRLLPEVAAGHFQAGLERAGIEFILTNTLTHLEKNTDGTFQAHLNDGQTITTDAVLSAIGLKPNTELAERASIVVNRGIVADLHLQTNQADIYAVGDCAEVNDTLLPYVMPIMQQARALAKTLNGERTTVHYPAMPVAVKTPALPLTVLPVPANVDVHWETEHLEDGMIAKAIDTNATLRGFVLLGSTAAKQRLTLTKLVPDLIPA